MAISGRFVNYDKAYAITLPEGWLRIDFRSDFGQLIRDATAADPAVQALCPMSDPAAHRSCIDEQLASIETNLQALDTAGAEIAVDLGTVTKPFPTMVVITAESDPGVTPDLLLAVGPAGLRAGGVTGRIESGLLDLPAGTAAYFYYRVPAAQVAITGGRARQFHLVAHDTLISVIVIGHKTDEQLAASANELMQSLELLD